MRATVIAADLLVFIPAALAIAALLRAEAQAVHRRRCAAAAKKAGGEGNAAGGARGGAATSAPDPPSLRRRRAARGTEARTAAPEPRVEPARARDEPPLRELGMHWAMDALPLLAMPALLIVDHGHFQVRWSAGHGDAWGR